ncbi:membrane protein [Beggiatoa sp. SS]|nr:membrane protein [Beggiatoa sp. SS]
MSFVVGIYVLGLSANFAAFRACGFSRVVVLRGGDMFFFLVLLYALCGLVCHLEDVRILLGVRRVVELVVVVAFLFSDFAFCLSLFGYLSYMVLVFWGWND